MKKNLSFLSVAAFVCIAWGQPNDRACSNVVDSVNATYHTRIRELRNPDGNEHNLYYDRDPWNADMSYMVGVQSDLQQANAKVVLYNGAGCYLKDLFPISRYDWRLTWDRKNAGILYTWWGSDLFRYNVDTRQAELLKSFAPLRLKPNGPSVNEAGDRLLVITSDNVFHSYRLPDMQDERTFKASFPEGCVTGWDKERYLGYKNYVMTFCSSAGMTTQAVLIYDDGGKLFHRFDGIGGGGHHDFSADGKWAYFTHWGPGPMEIHVVNLDGSDDRVLLSVPVPQMKHVQNLHLSWPRKASDWFIASFFPNAQNLPTTYTPYQDEIVQIRLDGTHRVLARSMTSYSTASRRSGGANDSFWAQPLARPSSDGSRLTFDSNVSGTVEQYILFLNDGPTAAGERTQSGSTK